MDVRKVAKLLHYSERHVKRLARAGKLPARKIRVKHTVIVIRYEFPDDLLERIDYEPYATKRKQRSEAGG